MIFYENRWIFADDKWLASCPNFSLKDKCCLCAILNIKYYEYGNK